VLAERVMPVPVPVPLRLGGLCLGTHPFGAALHLRGRKVSQIEVGGSRPVKTRPDNTLCTEGSNIDCDRLELQELV
jgi:hypothetical protein